MSFSIAIDGALAAGGLPGEQAKIILAETQCFWCDIPLAEGRGGASERVHNHRTFDHLIPKKRGGSNTVYNICVACDLCNQLRGEQSVQAFRGMVRQTILPHRADLVAMGDAFLHAGEFSKASRCWNYSGMPVDERDRRVEEHGKRPPLTTIKNCKLAIRLEQHRFKREYETMSQPDRLASVLSHPEPQPSNLAGLVTTIARLNAIIDLTSWINDEGQPELMAVRDSYADMLRASLRDQQAAG